MSVIFDDEVGVRRVRRYGRWRWKWEVWALRERENTWGHVIEKRVVAASGYERTEEQAREAGRLACLADVDLAPPPAPPKFSVRPTAAPTQAVDVLIGKSRVATVSIGPADADVSRIDVVLLRAGADGGAKSVEVTQGPLPETEDDTPTVPLIRLTSPSDRVLAFVYVPRSSTYVTDGAITPAEEIFG